MADGKECGAVLNSVVEEAMESMAFLEALPREETPVFAENVMGVSLAVLAPVAGVFHLLVEKELVQYLAEILYGSSQKEITEQHRNDLLAELLNTVAGRFLSETVPSNESFRLGIPQIMTGFSTLPSPPARCRHFQVEGMNFSVCLGGELCGTFFRE